MSLNSIFKQPIPTPKETKPFIPQQAKQSVKPNSEPSERKTRSDKLHDVKFPVTIEQRKALRIIAQMHNETETISNSKLIHHKLTTITQIPLLDYKDTKRYMHAKLNLRDYQKLNDIAIKQDMSIRKALTLIMLSILEEKGVHT